MEDQRIRVTKAMLRDALLEILKKKKLESVSVTELCQAAQVNRTTFYKYYGTPQDLLWDIADEFFDSVRQQLESENAPDAGRLQKALEYLDQERDVFSILVNSIPDKIFMERLFQMADAFDYLPAGTYAAADLPYVRTFLFHGGYAVIRSWLNSDRPESAADIARLILNLWKKLN